MNEHEEGKGGREGGLAVFFDSFRRYKASSLLLILACFFFFFFFHPITLSFNLPLPPSSGIVMYALFPGSKTIMG